MNASCVSSFGLSVYGCNALGAGAAGAISGEEPFQFGTVWSDACNERRRRNRYFTLNFPTASADELNRSVTDVAAASTAINDSFRILMAEDNPINQRVGVLMLSRAGFDVDVVADGSQAVQAHREKHYQLILMDLHMPVMDGIEATRRIRKLGDEQPMIIAVTADVLAGAREKCLEAGMDGYLSKPFTSNQLVEVVVNARDHMIGAESRVDAELLSAR